MLGHSEHPCEAVTHYTQAFHYQFLQVELLIQKVYSFKYMIQTTKLPC